MATERLYFADSHLLEFEARVVATVAREGRAAIVLDRTAFYPTGGGQPHDTGRLAAADPGGATTSDAWRVEEVLADETEDRVLHFVSGEPAGAGAALPPIGTRLRGSVDAARRRDHLQQHTGQHILSQALMQAAAIETRSFHLGATSSTIDVDPRVTPEITARALALANDVVFSDRPLRVHVVDAAELPKWNVRRQTFHGERIRLVEIEGFDVSTCGGTHAHRAGEVGGIAVLGVERTKGMHRVEFVCGGRTLQALEERRRVVDEASRLLATAAEQLPAQIGKLQEAEKRARKRAQSLFELAADAQAAALLAQAQPIGAARVVSALLAELSVDEALLLGKRLTNGPGIVALLGVPEPPGGKLLLARSADVPLALGALVKPIAERFGGRGGGSASFAQAAIAHAQELPAALAAALAALPR